MQSDSKKPRGAVAILIKNEADDHWLLMIKRRENPKDPWSGQMAFPGGHSDPTDRRLYDTARRETIEEVGIDLNEHRFLGCLSNVQTRNVPIIVSPFVFVGLKNIDPTTSREATEFIWVPISFLENPKNICSVMLRIRDANVLLGAYNYLGHVIWGMSFRIIREIISTITNYAET